MRNKSLIRIVILIMALVAVMGVLASVGKNVVPDDKSDTDSSSKVTTFEEETFIPTTEVVEPTETQEGHIHEFGDPVITKEASCVAEGEQKLNCIGCAATKIESLPKTNKHKYNDSGYCTLCGSVCKHNWSKYVTSTIDSTKHIRQCFVCNAKETDLHYYTNGTCFVCDAECSHSSYTIVDETDYVPYDEHQHTYKWIAECDLCKWRFKMDDGDVSSHEFINGYCEICGYGDASRCPHSYTGWEWRDIDPVSSLGNAQHQISYILVCYHCSTILDTREEIAGCGNYNGYCPSCGYCWDFGDDDYGGDPSCSHSNTSFDGEGCWTFDFCQDCGAILNREHSGFQDNGIDGRCAHCGEY